LTLELIGEGGDRGIRLDVGIVARKSAIHLRVAQRRRAVAAGRQLRHQRDDDARLARIQRGEALPPLHGGCVVASRRGLGRKGLERPLMLTRQSRALFIRPPLQLRRARYVHAVEERTGVQLHGASAIATRQRRSELPDVAGDPGGIERELLTTEKHPIASEIALQLIERLIQSVARTLAVGLGPEQSEKLLAREPARAVRGEHRQEGKAAACRRRPRRGGSPIEAFDREPAECSQSQHAHCLHGAGRLH
jgi:hypothetical protein